MARAGADDELHIEVLQGQTLLLYFHWTDGDNAEVDTTGYTAAMSVRPARGSATELISLTTANGRIVVGITGDLFGAGSVYSSLGIAAADTATLPPGAHYYDLFMTAPGGAATPVLAGRFLVKEAIT